MSRTDKDRPYTVRENDPKEQRIAYHDHLRFGKPIYKTVPVKDASGNKMFTEEKIVRRKLVYNAALKAFVATVEEHVWKRPVTEKVLVGHIHDECTLDFDQTKEINYRWDPFPCSYYLAFDRMNRPRVEEKKSYHGSAKRAESNALRDLTKLVNSGEDIEDFFDEDLETRVNFHKGYWD